METAASMPGFSTISPPVFNGENYETWEIKMKAFVEGADLWEAVAEDYEVAPLPDNPTINQIKYHKQRVTRKAKAKLCLYAAVSPNIFTRIIRLQSAKAIWDYLKGEYEADQKRKGMKVLNLMREFEKQQMKEDESVQEYADRLVQIQIANKVRVLGTNASDERLVQKILVSVPEKFETTVASMDNSRELSDIKLVEVLSALQAQEQRRMMRKEVPLEGAFASNT
ncbi:uncharacterized protein LOC116213566 [Punica granatum]|uniref:Uncharacterized protein LOC116213566 n=1 Tax=Punica granatum TaxID=22663 RepID=A0A6P8ED26_PUNGR|nr:uncharacterized protein LOC116213566 [Punica granatum]